MKFTNNSFPFLNTISVLFTIILLIILLYAYPQFKHPYYTWISLAQIFLVSVLCTLFSYTNSIILQLYSLNFQLFWVQRVIITFFFPNELDFYEHMKFTAADIQNSTFMLLGVCCAILIATLVYNKFLQRRKSHSVNNIEDDINPDILKHSSNTFRRNFLDFIQLSLKLIIAGYLVKLLVLFGTGVGFTGMTYSSAQTLLKWFSDLVDVFSFLLFFILFTKNKIKSTIYFKIAFFLFIISSLILSSRALPFVLLMNYLIISSLFKYRIGKITKFYMVVGFIGSIVILFPLITGLRTYIVSGNFDPFRNFSKILFVFSSRLSFYDPTTLWLTFPRSAIPVNLTLYGEIIDTINRFYIGELIPMPERVEIAKLMVLYGRGVIGNFNEIGGHAENLGPFSLLWLYFGTWGTFIYYFFFTIVQHKVMDTKWHVFVKFAFLFFYSIGPAQGIIIPSGSFLLFMILFLVTFSFIMVRKLVRPLFQPSTSQ